MSDFHKQFAKVGLAALLATSAPFALNAQDEGAEPVEAEETEPNFLDRDALAEALGIPADDPRLPELDDEVVVALNKSMNGWQNSNHSFDLGEADEEGNTSGSDLLDRIIEEELNPAQIRLVVKAAFEQAKFEGFADRFTEKAEAATNEKQAEKFAANAERMSARGQSQSDKFEGRVEDAADEAVEEAAAEAVSETATATATESAKAAAKEKAKATGKEKAREKAKNEARDKAKAKARENASEKAKEKAKDKARGRN